MLENFRNGSSVKLLYTYQGYEDGVLKTYNQELRGLLYKENITMGRILLVSDASIKGANIYKGIPNVCFLHLNSIKAISSTRFKKEISELLNKQYKNLVEICNSEREMERLRHNALKMQKDMSQSSIDLFNILTQSNLKDMISWNLRIEKDFSPESYHHRVYGSDSSLFYKFKSITNKGKYVEIILDFTLIRDERLLSKELEDRIYRNESVSNYDIKTYTPNESRLLQAFNGKAELTVTDKDYTIQDKGWVSFTVDLDVKFKVDLSEYEKWFKQVTRHINKYFPIDSEKN